MAFLFKSYNKQNKLNFLAFTLAETLIVMGIIGIVSALTLPNLNSSTGDKEQVAKVKKIYQNLTDAFDRAQVIYGPITGWCGWSGGICPASPDRLGGRILEFMKLSKDCYIPRASHQYCFSSAPELKLDGTQLNSNTAEEWGDGYTAILADGTSIYISGGSSVSIKVDIDGPNKGKNRQGYDLHNFAIAENDGIFSVCLGSNYSKFSGAFSSNTYPTAWVIMNENMDYKKCASTLNWETKTTCK